MAERHTMLMVAEEPATFECPACARVLVFEQGRLTVQVTGDQMALHGGSWSNSLAGVDLSITGVEIER